MTSAVLMSVNVSIRSHSVCDENGRVRNAFILLHSSEVASCKYADTDCHGIPPRPQGQRSRLLKALRVGLETAIQNKTRTLLSFSRKPPQTSEAAKWGVAVAAQKTATPGQWHGLGANRPTTPILAGHGTEIFGFLRSRPQMFSARSCR
jgi:hypothetical protein